MAGERADQFLLVHRMLADFPVGGTAEDGFLEDGQFENVVVETPDFSGCFPFLRVPEMELLVAARGADPTAILAERHRKHRALMRRVADFQIAVGRGINTRRAVAAGGG